MNEYLPRMNEAVAAEYAAILEFQKAKLVYEAALSALAMATSEAREAIERYVKQGEA